MGEGAQLLVAELHHPFAHLAGLAALPDIAALLQGVMDIADPLAGNARALVGSPERS